MKSDKDRGEFGSWLRKQRVARFSNVAEAVAAMKREAGYGITLSEWAEFEAGTRRPSAERRAALQEFLGAAPPEPPEQAQDLNPASVEAIRALTAAAEASAAAMREIAVEMRLARAADQARSEGLAAALGDLAGTLERLRLAPAAQSGE